MKNLFIIVGMATLCALQVSANILVNGDFSSAITMADSKLVSGSGVDEGAPGSPSGNAVDQGWVTVGTLAAPKWAVAGGKAVRQNINTSGSFGFGQIISNPNDGSFDNGDIVTFSFDYDLNTANTAGLEYRVYGIIGSGAWLPNGGLDRILLEAPESGTIGDGLGNYTLYELDAGTYGAGKVVVAGSHSGNIGLNQQFDYFGVALYSGLRNSNVVTIANVDLSALAVTVPPTAPTGLVATTAGATLGAIDLSWTDTSTNEQGFVISRGLTAGSLVSVATNGANHTSYSDTGLADSTEYFYSVRAFNSQGDSTETPVASATTLATLPPNLLVNGGGDSALTLWVSKLADGDTANGIVGGTTIDAGWISYGGTDRWTIGAGSIDRGPTATSSLAGLAQFVGNPGDGRFDNGDTIKFSFDYAGNTGSKFLGYSVYGITGSGTWAGNSGDSINLEDSTVSTGTWTGVNYTFTELANVRSNNVVAANVSTDLVLTNQYDYFAVAFWANGTTLSISNVYLGVSSAPPTSFNITSFDVQNDVGGVVATVGFDGNSGPTYVLQTKPDLTTASWTSVATATSSPLVYTNSSASAASFFQVQVQ